MTNIFDIIDELLVSGHPAVIHFPIIGIMMGFAAAATALIIAIVFDVSEKRFDENEIRWSEKMVDRYEFASWIMIGMGEVGLLVAAWSGFRSAGGVDTAVSNELLAYKIRLSIYTFSILIVPIAMKVYLSVFERKQIFGHSKIIPILYIIPMAIGAFLTILISGAGGRYTYGHSILDTLGLGWLLPG